MNEGGFHSGFLFGIFIGAAVAIIMMFIFVVPIVGATKDQRITMQNIETASKMCQSNDDIRHIEADAMAVIVTCENTASFRIKKGSNEK